MAPLILRGGYGQNRTILFDALAPWLQRRPGIGANATRNTWIWLARMWAAIARPRAADAGCCALRIFAMRLDP
jgi:hypothetical protein